MLTLGVAEWCLDVCGPASLPRAASLGFESVHVDFGDPASASNLGNESWRRAYQAEARASGVRISAVAANAVARIGAFGARGSAAVEASRAVVVASVAAAVDLGASLVIVPAFGESRVTDDASFGQMAALLRQACEAAGSSPVVIATENTLCPSESLRLVAHVGHPRLRVMVDTYDAVAWGHDPVEMITVLRNHMCDQVHLKDGRYGLGGNTAIASGDGRLAEVAASLARVGFQGQLVSATSYRTDAERRVAADRATLRRLFPSLRAPASAHAIRVGAPPSNEALAG